MALNTDADPPGSRARYPTPVSPLLSSFYTVSHRTRPRRFTHSSDRSWYACSQLSFPHAAELTVWRTVHQPFNAHLARGSRRRIRAARLRVPDWHELQYGRTWAALDCYRVREPGQRRCGARRCLWRCQRRHLVVELKSDDKIAQAIGRIRVREARLAQSCQNLRADMRCRAYLREVFGSYCVV
jgi:hypothetical protein